MLTLWFVLAGIVGYLLGSANSSLIVGKFYGVDVRKHGSGNAGTTNALRTLGKKAALLVLTGDMLKGIIAYLIGLYATGSPTGGMIGGTAAILGHVWPVFFGFKGGKGALTTLAVLLMIDWQVALAVLGVFIIIVALTRFVSLGSITGSVVFPLLSLFMHRSTVSVTFAIIIGILVIFLHRSNIKRLIAGTESKLGEKKKEDGNG